LNHFSQVFVHVHCSLAVHWQRADTVNVSDVEAEDGDNDEDRQFLDLIDLIQSIYRSQSKTMLGEVY
jgi:hypothetical protein